MRGRGEERRAGGARGGVMTRSPGSRMWQRRGFSCHPSPGLLASLAVPLRRDTRSPPPRETLAKSFIHSWSLLTLRCHLSVCLFEVLLSSVKS